MRNQWRIEDLTGKKYNMLTVVSMQQSNPVIWKCLCDCGNYTYVRTSNLKQGKVKSCGCLHKRGNPIHNQSKTRLYAIRAKMIRRCYIENEPAYHNYGERGIKMCIEWKNSIESFIKWAYENGYSDGLTIDRIDNDGDYCPENCRWVDYKQQSNNRRSNRMYTYNGKTQNLKQWCEEFGLPYPRIHRRIKLGWDFEEAVEYTSDARLVKRRKE